MTVMNLCPMIITLNYIYMLIKTHCFNKYSISNFFSPLLVTNRIHYILEKIKIESWGSVLLVYKQRINQRILQCNYQLFICHIMQGIQLIVCAMSVLAWNVSGQLWLVWSFNQFVYDLSFNLMWSLFSNVHVKQFNYKVANM